MATRRLGTRDPRIESPYYRASASTDGCDGVCPGYPQGGNYTILLELQHERIYTYIYQICCQYSVEFLSNGRETAVVFTTTSATRRIISARRARNDEREALQDAFYRLQSKP